MVRMVSSEEKNQISQLVESVKRCVKEIRHQHKLAVDYTDHLRRNRDHIRMNYHNIRKLVIQMVEATAALNELDKRYHPAHKIAHSLHVCVRDDFTERLINDSGERPDLLLQVVEHRILDHLGGVLRHL